MAYPTGNRNNGRGEALRQGVPIDPSAGRGDRSDPGSPARDRDASNAGAAGNDEALNFAARFGECFRSFWLLAVAIVGDRTLAEDVVQEAALTALTRLDQFHPEKAGSSFQAWMGQIVRYTALNARRKTQRHGGTVAPDTLDQSTPSPAPAASDRPRLTPHGQMCDGQDYFDDQIVAALRELHDTPRACLLLRIVESLDYRHIAELMGIPENTAMSHVHRARGYLRQRLADLKPASPNPRAPSS